MTEARGGQRSQLGPNQGPDCCRTCKTAGPVSAVAMLRGRFGWLVGNRTVTVIASLWSQGLG